MSVNIYMFLFKIISFPCPSSPSLAWEGRIVVVGFAGGTIASVPANLLLLKNVSAMGLYWSRYKEQNFPVFSRTLSSALQYCQQGRIQPHIGAVFKLEEVRRSEGMGCG